MADELSLPPTADVLPDVTHLVTEDDTPVDNIGSEKQQRLLVDPLHASWDTGNGPRDFAATANVGLFWAVEEPPLVPDMLLSLDVKIPANFWEKGNRSYFVWRFGKVPDVVIEIVSNREGGEDDRKLRTYGRLNIPYYVIFDPQRLLSEEVLRVYTRIQGKYELIPSEWLSAVTLGLMLWQGTFEGMEAQWLRWCDHNGQPLLTGAERAALERQRGQEQKQRAEQEKQRAEQEKQRAEQEKQRAEQEKQRAEQEKQRAEQEKQRAERLVAQLRALGIEPEV